MEKCRRDRTETEIETEGQTNEARSEGKTARIGKQHEID